MKKLIRAATVAWVVYAIAVLPVVAQQRLNGKVVDNRTKEPIEGANVSYGNSHGVSTDTNGNFRIRCQSAMKITISYIGYQTFIKRVRNCNTSIEVGLIPQSYSLQRTTVEDRAYIHRAASIGILNGSDLNKQSGLRLRDALNTVPGVEMQTRSPWGGQRITIRGYYPNAGNTANFNGLGYQLFLNNVPVTDATGTTIMDDIDFSTLERVEVIKGPSPLYGNEIAGTINLYSQRPQKNGTVISQQAIAGSYGLFRNNTTLVSKSANMDLRINYGHQTYDSFRPHDHSKKDYISLNGHYKVSDHDLVGVYFSYNHSDEDLAGGIFKDDFYEQKAIANTNYVNNNGGVNIKSFRAGITVNHQLDTHFDNTTTVFTTGHTLDQNFAHGFNYHNNWNVGARTRFTYRQQINEVGVNGQLGALVQKSNESVDGVFIPPSVSPPFTPESKPQIPTNDQNYALNYNLFTKWDVSLPHDFKVSVGGVLNFNKFGIRNMLRDDRLYSGSSTESKRFDPSFSPSVSALKSLSDNASVYASLSTGNAPPLLGDILASDGSVNDQLKPENAVQYEMGSKGNLLNNRLTYSAALFDLEIDNRLAAQFMDGVSYTTNVGKQQNRGFELSIGYKLIQNPVASVSLLHLWGSYTYSDFTYKDFRVFEQNTAGNDSTTADFAGNNVAGVAPNMLNLGIDMQTRPGFYMHAKYKYMDKTPITFDNRQSVKTYNLLSARIGYQRVIGDHFKLDAFVGSNNLTGSTYYNFLFIGQNVSALGDGYISPAPYKTTVYGGLTLKYRL